MCYENEKNIYDYPQVYLEECNCKIRKIKMSECINADLESDFSPDSEWL